MTLKQKPWICAAALAAGAVLIFFVEWLGRAFDGHRGDIAWISNAPACGTWVGRYPGEYCGSYGAKLPGNRKNKAKGRVLWAFLTN